MAPRLSKEEVVSIQVLAKHEVRNTEIARQLGVTEGAVRYHRRREASGAVDGRRNKPHRAREMAPVIAEWFAARSEDRRPVNVVELHEHLVSEFGYAGSYQSVRRYVRQIYGSPPIRTYRRVETPPGAQSQTDWGEFPQVDIGNGPEPLHLFVMTLSHSRMPAMIWSRREDSLSWLGCHNASYRRLGAVAATNRIDNVKTAIATGAGAWGEIQPSYRAYAHTVGFHIDACAPRSPEAKAKVESKVHLARLRIDVRRPHDGLEHLQDETDRQIARWSRQAICPATGLTVVESWERELATMRPLPLLPEPFDVAVHRPVHRDCTVRFEDRSYTVPFGLVDRRVEVRGCMRTVQILFEGRIVREYPRRTSERILIDPSCYEGRATEWATPPPPLGKLGRKLQEIAEMPVALRPLDLYAALAEVAR